MRSGLWLVSTARWDPPETSLRVRRDTVDVTVYGNACS